MKAIINNTTCCYQPFRGFCDTRKPKRLFIHHFGIYMYESEKSMNPEKLPSKIPGPVKNRPIFQTFNIEGGFSRMPGL